MTRTSSVSTKISPLCCGLETVTPFLKGEDSSESVHPAWRDLRMTLRIIRPNEILHVSEHLLRG